MTFSPDPQNTWQGPRVRMRNLSAFKIIGPIGAERRAKGGALFHINLKGLLKDVPVGNILSFVRQVNIFFFD